jgi:hypothetical protein
MERTAVDALVPEDAWVLGVGSHYANYHNGNNCEYFVWIKINSSSALEEIEAFVRNKAAVFDGDENFRRVSVSPQVTRVVNEPEFLIEVQAYSSPAFDLNCH